MSLSSRLIEGLLVLSGAAKGVSSECFYRKLRKAAIRADRGIGVPPFLCGVRTEKGIYCGMPYFVFIPKVMETKKAIMYIHGSAYMNAPRTSQFLFAAGLAKKTHARVYFPLYPKLPYSTVLPCFALLNNYYAFLGKQGEIIPVGDSSGAAMALSLALMRSEILDVIAISPWVSLSICEEGRAMSCDVMLSVTLLDHVAELWAKGIPCKDVRLSPAQGIFKGKRLYLTCGDKERFRPDIIAFCREQARQGASITYLEGRGQQHCYPLMPTPEGRTARADIVRYLQKLIYGDRV